DATEHYRHVRPGFLAALRIHQRAAVRARAGDTVRGIGIVRTRFAVGGVAIDHRVHVAGGHTEEQVRLAERHEGVLRGPVRLADDADAEALGLQQAADDGHAE